MRSTRLLGLCFVVMIFAGCAAMMGQSSVEYQDNHAVAPGQIILDHKGLYSIAFQDENYHIERSYFRTVFMPKDIWAANVGPYAIKVLPVKNLAKSYRNDKVKIFDLMLRKEIGRKTAKTVVVLNQEERDFRGHVGLYREFFVPESITKNMDGDTIKNPARGFAAILFTHEDSVYWIVHNDPFDALVLQDKKIEPGVHARTVENFKKFLDGFSFGVPNGASH